MSRRPSRSRVVAPIALLTLLALAGCGSTVYVDSSPGQAVPTATLGWSKVDPISVKLPTSEAITRNATVPTGSVPILINIWASWCAPCKEELPLLEQVEKTGRLQVIGFSRDTDKSSAAAALRAAGVSYPNWLDSAAALAVALDNRVPLSAVPSSVLIRDGKVVAVHIGQFKSRADVLAALEQK